MTLSTDKTKTLHFTVQDPVSPTTPEEAATQCKFTCPHLNCGFKFLSKSGLHTHMVRCEWKDELLCLVHAGVFQATMSGYSHHISSHSAMTLGDS